MASTPPASTPAAFTAPKEGNLEAPIRHPLDWKNPQFHDREALVGELTRVFDHCHGCRRCVNLCNAFPTLFDLVDASPTLEVDGVAGEDYWKVVDQCYLCDLCYQTKCPYIPPHEWNIDFPHLMLRAKAVKFQHGGAADNTGRRQGVSLGEKILSATDAVGKLAAIPIVVNGVNAANRFKPWRKLLDHALGVHPEARIPRYHSDTLRKRRQTAIGQAPDSLDSLDSLDSTDSTDSPTSPGVPTAESRATAETTGRVAIFATCFGNYNEPDLGCDLIKVLTHNGLAVRLVDKERCCGMPKLELGDLAAVDHARQVNIPPLAALASQGWDLLAPVPSCVLMFRQELPLMFPDDAAVRAVADAMFDPFEYLMRRHRAGLLNTDFKRSLGKIAYHVACHQRVQKIGMQTKHCLELAPNTEIHAIERCSGHDGTYGVKSRFYASARKIVAPVVHKVRQLEADHYGSDCPMAGRFIQHGLGDGSRAEHPISLLKMAYGL